VALGDTVLVLTEVVDVDSETVGEGATVGVSPKELDSVNVRVPVAQTVPDSVVVRLTDTLDDTELELDMVLL
jgi:hypothetical protein